MDWFKDKSSFTQREFLKTLIIPTAIVFLAFFSATLWAWSSARQSVNAEVDQELTSRVADTSGAIVLRMTMYEEILRGGVGLFHASNEVTREDWKAYIRNFDISDRYPGVRGVGYAEVVPPARVGSFTSEMRNSGLKGFKITPGGERTTYTAITFLEPLDEQNKVAIGYDMFSEAIRRKAMEHARDSGTAAISESVTLVQNRTPSNNQPGFLMYLPHYKRGMPLDTVRQRRAAIQGYVYAAFRTNDLFNGIFDENHDGALGYKIYAGSEAEGNLVHTSGSFEQISKTAKPHVRIQNVELMGETWKIRYVVSQNIVSARERIRPISTLVWGNLLSFLIAFSVFRLLKRRAHTLAEAQAKEVQLAKDDLLSLASHQLRTPATGVKQYIGMLREGYAGSLTTDQRTFLELAYESNERQLHIINELLYVAKADSGRIVLAKRKLNLNTLVKEVAREHKTALTDNQHSMRLKLPKKAVIVQADPHCVRMALDNLVSNAIKYTPPKGKISIHLYKDKDVARIGVKDNGVGITNEQKNLLFKQFSRIPNAMSEQTSGSGIGLYLAQHLIRLHGGNIGVESESDKGTCFTIQLPLKETAEAKKV